MKSAMPPDRCSDVAWVNATGWSTVYNLGGCCKVVKAVETAETNEPGKMQSTLPLGDATELDQTPVPPGISTPIAGVTIVVEPGIVEASIVRAKARAGITAKKPKHMTPEEHSIWIADQFVTGAACNAEETHEFTGKAEIDGNSGTPQVVIAGESTKNTRFIFLRARAGELGNEFDFDTSIRSNGVPFFHVLSKQRGADDGRRLDAENSSEYLAGSKGPSSREK